MILTIAVIFAMASFATHMYLPAMAQLGAELGATDSQAQMAISAFVIGMVAGQLLIGSGALAVLSGVVSAIAPTIGMHIVVRGVPGLRSGRLDGVGSLDNPGPGEG